MSTEEPDGWVRLDAERSWARVLEKVSPFDFTPSGLWDFVVVVILGILYFILLGVVRALLPRPRVHLALRKLRVGHRTLDFAYVNTASLVIARHRKSRDIDLRFGKTGGTKLYVRLTAGDRSVIARQTRDILEHIIEGSSIDTRSERDQQSRSKYSYPTGLSREDALAVIRNPPKPGERLPADH